MIAKFIPVVRMLLAIRGDELVQLDTNFPHLVKRMFTAGEISLHQLAEQASGVSRHQ